MTKASEKDLNLAKRKNLIAHTDWLGSSKPEGDSVLNDSNREVIAVYARCYPRALCVNTYTGEIFSPLETPCCNFSCSCVFDGDEADLTSVKASLDMFRKNPSITTFDIFEETIKNAHPMYIIWA